MKKKTKKIAYKYFYAMALESMDNYYLVHIVFLFFTGCEMLNFCFSFPLHLATTILIF